MTKQKAEFDDVGAHNIIQKTRGNGRKRPKAAQYNGCTINNIHINVVDHHDPGDGDDSGDSDYTPDQTQESERKSWKEDGVVRIESKRIKKNNENKSK